MIERKTYKIFQENDYLVLDFLTGTHSKEEQEEENSTIYDDFDKEAKAMPGDKVNGLGDMSKVESINIIDKDSSEIYKKMINHPRSNKIAIVGGKNPVVRGVINFVISFSGKKDKVKYFDKKEEAISWFKEE